METAASENNSLIVVGDLNVDILTEKKHRLLDIMNFVDLNNCIKSPTRYGPTRQSLLDLILVKECSIVNSEVVDIDRLISDHNGVLVNININTNFKSAYKREIWDYRRGDFEKFNEDTVNVVIFAGGNFRENVGKTFHVGVIFTILLLFSS